MKLQQLRYLLAVAENGMNMTAAAERLHTSQPGVSKQLRLLEQELGLSLFVRKGRSLEGLTAEGEEVVARAARVMREVEVIRGISGELYDQQTGKLSIGTTHTQARYVLPDVIRRFRERYPDVSLDLHQGTSEQLAQMAEQRRIDFVIVSEPRQRFQDLYLLPCFHWDRVIIVPRDHDLAALEGKPTIEQLAEHPLVTYVFSFDRESSLKRAFGAKGLEPKVVFTARDADVIKTYVRIGLGIGVVASMAQDCGEQDDLVALDGAGLFPRCTTWLGFRRDLVLRRFMYEFIELFATHLDERRVREMVMLDDQSRIDEAMGALSLPVMTACGEMQDGTV